MAEVETVRGPVDVRAPGQLLMHEHLFTLGTEIRQNYPDYPDPWDEDHRVAGAVAELKECASGGIRTIVDPTVLGLGRYIARVQRINEQVDINIVVATGIYTHHDEPMQFHFIGPGRVFDVPEPMVELFVTGSASTCSCRSRTGSTPSPRSPATGTPTAWCSPTTPRATATSTLSSAA